MYHVSTRIAPRSFLAPNLLALAKGLTSGIAKLQTLLLESGIERL